jgi:hypothetical protein
LELSHEGKKKLSRAQKAIIMASQRRLWLPADAPWVDEYVAELGMFTGDEKVDSYTDQVDATAYCCGKQGLFAGTGELPEVIGLPMQR